MLIVKQLQACFLNRRDTKAIKPNAKIAKVPGSGTAATREDEGAPTVNLIVSTVPDLEV